MLSHGLRQVLEGLPSRVPLSIEVLDRSFAAVLPEAAYRSTSSTELPPEIKEQLLAAPSARPRTLVQRGQRIDLYPVAAAGDRAWTLLLVIAADESDPTPLTAWGPILRSALEADLAAMDDVKRQAQLARHLGAVLRFVRYLAGIASETEMLRAVMQAAAVWFDLEPRIYRRDATGDFVPHMYLPSTDVPPHHRIPAATVEGITDALRLSSSADLEALGLTGDSAVLIPVAVSTPDLLLVLCGALPADAELTFGAIARVAGQVLEAGKRRAAAGVRKPLVAALAGGPSIDQALARVLRVLVDETRATGGSLVARAGSLSRPLARLGDMIQASPPPADGEVHVSAWADRMVVVLPAGPDGSIAIDLVRRGTEERFDMAARHALEHGTELLTAWLSGPGTQEAIRQAVSGVRRERSDAFLARIEEEIARAKRFQLDLALIVVRGESLEAADRFEQLLTKVRAELRDSDLLAPLGPLEVAALLIQTGGGGSEAVVRRLHRRLAEDELWRGSAVVGHAAFSQDCPTAAALLSRARTPESRGRLAVAAHERIGNSGQEEFFLEKE